MKTLTLQALALTGVLAMVPAPGAAQDATAATTEPTAVDVEALAAEVHATETAFAQTMADRDFDAFQAFLAEDAVFFTDPEPSRGKAQVAARWAAWFDGEAAPFSWRPEQVAVSGSGTLALSSGPVFNPAGERLATFTSTWRREADGEWRVVFDKGERWCEPPPPE